MLVRIIILILGLHFLGEATFSQAPCDKRRGCTDRSIVFDRNSGASRSHVFVDYRPFFGQLENGFTFEAKLNMDQVVGEKVYIAGIWGPNEEDNDAWVLYVDAGGNLVFEVENPVQIPQNEDRSVDNTRAVAPNFVQYMGTWTHIAAVFNPTTNSASIFINGVESAIGTNPNYPITRMSSPASKTLGMLIGSANSVTGAENFKSFKGRMDEIKIWSVPQTADWIDCHKNLSHSMNSANLLLYYRSNDPLNSYTLCDASNNGYSGSLRDANLVQGSFPNPAPFKVYEAASFPDTLKCERTKRYRFVVEDTSSCAAGINMRARTWEVNDEGRWINMNNSDLLPVDATPRDINNGIMAFEFEINADWVGTKRYVIRLQRNNSCGAVVYQNANVYITRITDVLMDIGNDTLDYGIISSFCESEQVVSKTIRISNNSDVTGTNRTLNVSNVSIPDPRWQVSSPSTPFQIPMGQSRDLTIDFINPNTSGTFTTDITINTDDQCSDGIYVIPSQVIVEDVFQVTSRNGQDSILEHDFGTVCLGQVSQALTFFLDNLSSRDIKLLSVSYPNGYDTRVDRNLPKDMPANQSFSDEYFLFIPPTEGNFDGEIIFRVETDNGCIIRYPIDIKGTGIDPDFEFVLPNIDYGNVVVGQELVIPIDIRNKSSLPLTLNLALNKSEVYFFNNGNRLTIGPQATRQIDVAFRPTAPNQYLDKLIAWENACNNTYTIDLTGQGVLEALSFSPEITRIDDVLGCGSETVSGEVVNISSSPIQLNNFELDDPAGKFTITEINSVQNPNLNIFTLPLAPGEKLEYTALYSPSDVTAERGDRAYLRFEDQDGNEWNAKLYGTSRLPRLYISNNGQFGIKEVGELEVRTLYVENVSTSGEITLDDIALAQGNQDMRILYPSTSDIQGRVLQLGDTMQILVEFQPNAPLSFNDTIFINTTQPCSIIGSEPISGFGKTYPLQIGIRDLAMGYAAPCECQRKEFYLDNESESSPISIDDISLDDTGLTYPSKQFFNWYSIYSPMGISPYEIPADSRDIVYLEYCPRQAPDRDSLNNETYFRLKASGEGWGPNDFNIYLIGKRKLLFEPTPDSTTFPPTRVDTLSEPQIGYIKVPNDIKLNPDNSIIRIDSITFVPDDRVFFASDSLERSFPIYVSSLDSMNIKFDFYPRAPRLYEADAILHIAEPCATNDSSLFVTGLGFAPAFGLAFHIDEPKLDRDTITISECDTLVIPFYTSREIPATVVDIDFRLSYDKSKYELLDITSEYFDPENSCPGFLSDKLLLESTDSTDIWRAKNLCGVDSIKPMFTARLLPKGLIRDTSIVRIDSISFDTEDIILYEVLAENDEIVVVVNEVSFEVVGDVSFPATQVLDCTEADYEIENTGQIPILVSDILGYSSDTLSIVTAPGASDTIWPGEIATVRFRFCPKRPVSLSNTVTTFIDRCYLSDSSEVFGLGFAPDFYTLSGTPESFISPDTVYGQIGEIIDIPVEFEKDIKIDFDGKQVYMTNVSFRTDISWNPRALRFLQFTPNGNFTPTVSDTPGFLELSFESEPTVLKGPIGTMRFLVTVPDVIDSPINFHNYGFDTKDILFYTFEETINSITFSSSQSCNISTLTFTDEITALSQNYPNPWIDKTRIEFSVSESEPVWLRIYDVSGNLVHTSYEGEILEFGNHILDLDSSLLESGIYYYELENGVFRESRRMVLIR